jgi:hypothetical protein
MARRPGRPTTSTGATAHPLKVDEAAPDKTLASLHRLSVEPADVIDTGKCDVHHQLNLSA